MTVYDSQVAGINFHQADVFKLIKSEMNIQESWPESTTDIIHHLKANKALFCNDIELIPELDSCNEFDSNAVKLIYNSETYGKLLIGHIPKYISEEISVIVRDLPEALKIKLKMLKLFRDKNTKDWMFSASIVLIIGK